MLQVSATSLLDPVPSVAAIDGGYTRDVAGISETFPTVGPEAFVCT